MDLARQLEKSKSAIDRISDLPDPILCKILSYLPTKNVVGTSILSRRWNNLFPFGVPPISLDIDDSLLLHPAQNQAYPAPAIFTDFVDKLFDRTFDGLSVDTIAFYLNRSWLYGNYKLCHWVWSIKELNVQQLILSMRHSVIEDRLFCRLDGCTTLVKLVVNLQGTNLWIPGGDFSLPNLKTMEFIDCILDNEECQVSIDGLVKGCPKLEDLSFMGFICKDQVLRIHSPVLKKLTLSDYSDYSDHALDLHTPNLQVFICTCYITCRYILSSLKSLLTAHIDIRPTESRRRLSDIHEAVASVVTACSSIIELYLSATSIRAQLCASAPLPTFWNLSCLRLGSLRFCGWEFLAKLLLNSPNLKELIVEEGFGKNQPGYADFKRWLPSPPSCLKTHLQKIEFCTFNWKEDEINFAEYFLENGEVLEKLTLCCRKAMDISTVKRLLSLPHNSKIVLE